MSMKHFLRLARANPLADALQGRTLFVGAVNGLFLTAPRRTGRAN